MSFYTWHLPLWSQSLSVYIFVFLPPILALLVAKYLTETIGSIILIPGIQALGLCLLIAIPCWYSYRQLQLCDV